VVFILASWTLLSTLLCMWGVAPPTPPRVVTSCACVVVEQAVWLVESVSMVLQALRMFAGLVECCASRRDALLCSSCCIPATQHEAAVVSEQCSRGARVPVLCLRRQYGLTVCFSVYVTGRGCVDTSVVCMTSAGSFWLCWLLCLGTTVCIISSGDACSIASRRRRLFCRHNGACVVPSTMQSTCAFVLTSFVAARVTIGLMHTCVCVWQGGFCIHACTALYCSLTVLCSC
jgi:hypothetical protein